MPAFPMTAACWTKKTGRSKSAEARESTRLDVAVAAAGGISRERAQALILAGAVRVDGETRRKPSVTVPRAATIEILARQRFVSRGALKLERALDVFDWPVEGLRCLDVGASTGGFTDCLLQRGAACVVAVDVGYGHLAWSLRNDPRVTLFERTNFRNAEVSALGAPFAFACADVSFISLVKLATKLSEALAQRAKVVALVKPQFEVGREAVERGGVVR
ncbi:MAG TPA: TlyA family RNA methyltransferase, partial [Candidatus Acidoferrales bacterium]|nr:TlyA family RNA methyltransferase [Candidatus Acidoferrales bacterium]